MFWDIRLPFLIHSLNSSNRETAWRNIVGNSPHAGKGRCGSHYGVEAWASQHIGSMGFSVLRCSCLVRHLRDLRHRIKQSTGEELQGKFLGKIS
jgi:hypothetical protein